MPGTGCYMQSGLVYLKSDAPVYYVSWTWLLGGILKCLCFLENTLIKSRAAESKFLLVRGLLQVCFCYEPPYIDLMLKGGGYVDTPKHFFFILEQFYSAKLRSRKVRLLFLYSFQNTRIKKKSLLVSHPDSLCKDTAKQHCLTLIRK